MKIDWQQLTEHAIAAMTKAYCPYSKFPVGAAGLVEDGRIVKGCNVENASYGLTLCAECSMISELIISGGGKLCAVVCVNAQTNYLSPCGRCRQLLYEFGGNELQLQTIKGPMILKEILPLAFGPEDLL